MKYLAIAAALLLSACAVSPEAELQAHLDAEQDFHSHSMYLEGVYENYDPEYVDDCLYYVELVCEFE